MAEHTPGRLTIDQWGGVITDDGERLLLTGVAITAGGCGAPTKLAEANTARMVRAWNAHDDLYAACDECRRWLEEDTYIDLNELSEDALAVLECVRAALAKAKGEAS